MCTNSLEVVKPIDLVLKRVFSNYWKTFVLVGLFVYAFVYEYCVSRKTNFYIVPKDDYIEADDSWRGFE